MIAQIDLDAFDKALFEFFKSQGCPDMRYVIAFHRGGKAGIAANIPDTGEVLTMLQCAAHTVQTTPPIHDTMATAGNA